MYRARVTRGTNHDRVLECIYRNPGISRKDISDLTGITPATVTTTVAQLAREGIVRELGFVAEDKGTIGRSRIALDIQADYGVAIGVECTTSALTICATDLRGKPLRNISVPYSQAVSENITQLIISHVSDCIRTLELPAEQIIGIGIAVPGHMDREQRRVISSNEKWTSFDGHEIARAFSCQVVFENNVRCMAAAQYLHAPQATPSSFALLHVGHGMFCANVVDDELYIGTTYGAGEIAHSVAIPDGKRCECGKRGCLQTIATDSAILEQAAQLYEADPNSLLHVFAASPEFLTIEHVAAAYAIGDAGVCKMIAQVIQYLCIALLNIAILMNPQKLFLHGILFQNSAIARDLMEQIREKYDFTKNNYNLGTVEILPVHHTDGAVGGAALAILKCLIHI